ncbi:protein kinase, ATP binding site-containing protein [Tanacetum coccineum]
MSATNISDMTIEACQAFLSYEVVMLSLYKHEHIVSLLGFCDDSEEKILVYEYVSKGSLDLYLEKDDLTWAKRLRICIGAACGLAYLHSSVGTQQRVLHRDVKSSNILLDENWNARISDLGLSKFGPANQQFTFLVSHAVGSIGYCDPLYVETGLLTKESDVYSFGVVLFEVLCGRLCIGNGNNKHLPLTRLVRQFYEQNKIDELVFNKIKDEINPKSLNVFTAIAYQCLNRDRETRPLMTEIVRELEKALEYQVVLYVDMEVYVDSGAQSTIISKTCAERSRLLRLVDERYKGIAHIGQSEIQILGRIHVAPVKIGNYFYPCSFVVLDSPNMEVIFGSDMLRHLQCTIDLKENVLRVGVGEDIPHNFLNEEKQLKEASSSGAQEDIHFLVTELFIVQTIQSLGSSTRKLSFDHLVRICDTAFDGLRICALVGTRVGGYVQALKYGSWADVALSDRMLCLMGCETFGVYGVLVFYALVVFDGGSRFGVLVLVWVIVGIPAAVHGEALASLEVRICSSCVPTYLGHKSGMSLLYDIYSIVDACKTANEMWIAIERLQQGESLNVQDVKTNLFWEFGKFTSRDGESIESYYSRFYKLMNELTRNNLQVTTMQYQNEVNDICAERIAKSANPLALLAAAQPYSDNYYQAPKPQRSNITSSYTRPSASTRHKGKEIAKPVTPQSESVSKEDSDPEQAQRDKDMQKNLALLAKYFKRLYKPTNNNLRTSLNSRNKIEDTTPRYNNDNQSGQFGNQKKMTVAGLGKRRTSTGQPLEQVQNHDESNVYNNVRRHSEQPESINDTYVLEKDDSNVTPDSLNICTNDNQVDQNAAECVDSVLRLLIYL